jgi:hypothetical protein
MRRMPSVVISILGVSMLVTSCAASSVTGAPVPAAPSTSSQVVQDAVLTGETFGPVVQQALESVSNLATTSTSTSDKNGKQTESKASNFYELDRGVTTASKSDNITFDSHIVGIGGQVFVSGDALRYAYEGKIWVLVNDQFLVDDEPTGSNALRTAGLGLHPGIYRLARATKNPIYLGSEIEDGQYVRHYQADVAIDDLIETSTGEEQTFYAETKSGVGGYNIHIDTWLDERNLPVRTVSKSVATDFELDSEASFTYDVDQKITAPPESEVFVP